MPGGKLEVPEDEDTSGGDQHSIDAAQAELVKLDEQLEDETECASRALHLADRAASSSRAKPTCAHSNAVVLPSRRARLPRSATSSIRSCTRFFRRGAKMARTSHGSPTRCRLRSRMISSIRRLGCRTNGSPTLRHERCRRSPNSSAPTPRSSRSKPCFPSDRDRCLYSRRMHACPRLRLASSTSRQIEVGSARSLASLRCFGTHRRSLIC